MQVDRSTNLLWIRPEYLGVMLYVHGAVCAFTLGETNVPQALWKHFSVLDKPTVGNTNNSLRTRCSYDSVSALWPLRMLTALP